MINTIFFLLYYIWSPSESTIVKKEELLLWCKHLTRNSDRCWKVGFMLFSSGILNINFAEKVESGLRNHQLWDGSWLFSLIICLTVCSFLSPILHVHVFNWLNSSTGNFVKCCIFGNVLTEIASKNKKKTCKNCKKGVFFLRLYEKNVIHAKFLSLCRTEVFLHLSPVDFPFYLDHFRCICITEINSC